MSLQGIVDHYLTAHGDADAIVELCVDGKPEFSYQTKGITEKSEEARFPIWSLTKSFIAVLIFRLADKGLVQIDEEIRALTSIDLPAWIQNATILDLLCHRSGLSDYGHLGEYQKALAEHPKAPISAEEMMSLVFREGPQFPVGAGFFYSNVGYRILVDILEKKSGKSIESLLRDEIFTPCGLNRSTVLASVEDMKGMVPGFSNYWGSQAVDVRTVYHPDWVLHGVLSSTVSDLNIFLNSVFSGKLVSSEALKLIKTPHALPFPHNLFKPAYGTGFLGDAASPIGMFLGNNGSGPGYSVSFFCLPQDGQRFLSVSLAINRDGVNLGEALAFELLKSAKLSLSA